MADKLRPDELAAFKAAFDMFDKNQDGTISTKVSGNAIVVKVKESSLLSTHFLTHTHESLGYANRLCDAFLPCLKTLRHSQRAEEKKLFSSLPFFCVNKESAMSTFFAICV